MIVFAFLCNVMMCGALQLKRGSQQVNSNLDHWGCFHNGIGYHYLFDFQDEDCNQGCWVPNCFDSPCGSVHEPEKSNAVILTASEINDGHCNQLLTSRRSIAKCLLRVGEALNPGPIPLCSDDSIIVGTINPTQILNKEDVFTSTLGPGIWGCCETAHTPVACDISTYRLRKQGWRSVWSKPTDPHRAGKSQLRGKAGGTCIISHFPLRQGGQQWPQEIVSSTRLVQAFIQLGPNCVMCILTVYGPPRNQTYSDTQALLRYITLFAAERALEFQGPTLLMGDLNCDLEELSMWQSLQSRGWNDLHALSAEINNHQLEATCQGARHSYILANSIVTGMLKSCRIEETYDFASHPTLYAHLNTRSVIRSGLTWCLPSATDDHIVDEQTLEEHADRCSERCHSKVVNFLRQGEPDRAMETFVHTFEECLRNSIVDCEGNRIPLPPRCIGRAKYPLSRKPVSVPIVKIGRPGDEQCAVPQPDLSLRRHTKQLRRLQALVFQMKACELSPSESKVDQCNELWKAILEATGFRKGFALWIVSTLGIFIPLALPPLATVTEVYEAFKKYHKNEESELILHRIHRRRVNVALDACKSGAQAFREIRERPKPPMTHVTFQLTATVKPQRWKKQGNAIVLHDPLQHEESFRKGHPLEFQGQTVEVIDVQPGHIKVHPCLRLRNTHDMSISQTIKSCDAIDMQIKTAEAWNTMWRRDKRDTDEIDPLTGDDWGAIPQFMTCLADCPSLPFQEFQVPKWKQVVARVKNKSSRGSCGFSKREVSIIPSSLLKTLFAMFAGFESNIPWPHVWALSRVVCLRKTEVPGNPLDTRPISIMSRMYRLWSSYRSAQVLEHLQGQMPPEVSGAAGIISSDLMAALTVDAVEHSVVNKQQCMGCVIDLQKCFNMIPRFPILVLLKLLGIPLPYIIGLRRILCDFRRVMEIGGSVGAEQWSSTGVAEGCSMSVACMTALTLWMGRIVKQVSPETLTIFFADNWSVLAHSFQDIVNSVQAIEEFVTALRMKISPSKSWCWATKYNDRVKLKALRLCETAVQICTKAIDLGCDVSYTSTRTLKSFNQRVAKAKGRFKNIGKGKYPLKLKRKLAKTGAQSVFNYGTEIVYIPPNKWNSVRSATVDSVGLAKSGISPYLALHATGINLDPQLLAIVRRFRFWRKYFRIFPERKSSFLHRLTLHNKGGGPAAAFRRTLADVGWTCHTEGRCKHSAGFWLDWLNCSDKFLNNMIQISWTQHVIAQTQHRKVPVQKCIDVVGMKRSVLPRGPREQGILATYIAGCNYTHDVLAKFVRNIDDKCPKCGLQDSRYHRVMCCNATKSIRDTHKQLFQWLQKQPQDVVHYGILHFSLDIVKLRCSSVDAPLVTSIPEPCDENIVIFSDGAAFFPEFWDLTLSAYAVIQVQEGSFEVIAQNSGLLQGADHSSFRAESMAILKACEMHYRFLAYCDCQAVIDLFMYMQLLASCDAPCPPCTHHDIWINIWNHIKARPEQTISLRKVKSHQNWRQITNPLEKWKAYMSGKVDKCAKDAVCVQHALVFRKHQQIAESRQKSSAWLKQYHDVLCRIADLFLDKQDQTQNRRQTGDTFVVPDFTSELCSGETQDIPLTISDDVLEQFPYNPVFGRRILQWLKHLRWPVSNGGDSRNISLLELYFDFAFFTESLAAVNVCPKSMQKNSKDIRYELRDLSVQADLMPNTLAEQSRTWTRALHWLLPKISELEWVQFLQVTSLEVVGHKTPHSGVNVRPRLVMGTMVYCALFRFFNTSGGRQVNLHKAFRVSVARGGA